jgi:4'-phosphopantetheinyl transferase
MSGISLVLVRFERQDRSRWLARSASILNSAEMARVVAIADPDSRVQHAVGRALVRVVAAQAAGCAPADVTVAVTDAGKPWLPAQPNLHFNVSHTGRAVVVAVGADAPVGVDIEAPAMMVAEPQRVAQRLFAASEVRTLRELPEGSVADWFTSVWTIKEAVAKALGVGVTPMLSRVVVKTSTAGLALRVVDPGPSAESWTLHQLIAPGGSEKIAVATPSPSVALAPVSVLTFGQFARALEAQGATART